MDVQTTSNHLLSKRSTSGLELSPGSSVGSFCGNASSPVSHTGVSRRRPKFKIKKQLSSGFHGVNFLIETDGGRPFVAKCDKSQKLTENEVIFYRMFKDIPWIRPYYGSVHVKFLEDKVDMHALKRYSVYVEKKCIALAWADYVLEDLSKDTPLFKNCPELRKHFARQATAAVKWLHDRNITHNDMSARQFLVKMSKKTGKPYLWLMDFSQAMLPPKDKEPYFRHDIKHFHSNVLARLRIKMNNYLPPEKSRSEKLADVLEYLPKADISAPECDLRSLS